MPKIFSILIIALVFLFPFQSAKAEEAAVSCGSGFHAEGTRCVPDPVDVSCGTGYHNDGTGTCVKNAAAVANPTLDNPLGTDDLRVLIGRIIKVILGLSGAVALLMFTYGGIQWLISRGDAKKVQAGKDTLTWAVFGLVVIFTAYALVGALLEAIGTVAQ